MSGTVNNALICYFSLSFVLLCKTGNVTPINFVRMYFVLLGIALLLVEKSYMRSSRS